jgi:xylulokinase
VLDTELVTVNAVEGAAYGAALLSAVGAGQWPDLTKACKQVIKITGITLPDEAQAAKYRDIYTLYRDLYPALKPSFQKMG